MPVTKIPIDKSVVLDIIEPSQSPGFLLPNSQQQAFVTSFANSFESVSRSDKSPRISPVYIAFLFSITNAEILKISSNYPYTDTRE